MARKTIQQLGALSLPALGTDAIPVARSSSAATQVDLADLPVSTAAQTALDAKADDDLSNVSSADLSAKDVTATGGEIYSLADIGEYIANLRGDDGTSFNTYVADLIVEDGSVEFPDTVPIGAIHKGSDHLGIIRCHPTPPTGGGEGIAPAWLLYGKDNVTFPGWHFIDFHENGRMPFRVYDAGGFYSTCGEVKPDGDWHIPGTITSGPIGWRNPVLNGGLDLWSRGSSGRPDGWYQVNAGGTTPTWSQQAFTPGQTDVPNAGNYFLRMTFTGTSSGSTPIISNRMEGVEQWAGRTIIVQYWIKSPTYPTTTVVVPYLIQRFGSGGSAAVTTNFSSVQITDAWTRVCFVTAVPSISGKTIGSTASSWEIGFGGTIGQTDQVLDIANLQIDPWEVGRAAPSASNPYYPQFQRIPIPLQESMAKRYYQTGSVRTENGSRWISLQTMAATPIVTASAGTASNASSIGFELAHTSAASSTITATAELA